MLCVCVVGACACGSAPVLWLLTHVPTPLPQIGAFTAASNITGLCADVDAVTALLHEYGALAFWDYATAGPYLKVCTYGGLLWHGGLGCHAPEGRVDVDMGGFVDWWVVSSRCTD